MEHKQRLLLQRTIDLAQDGFQKSSIYPLVGWVLITSDQIILEGWSISEEDFTSQITNFLSEKIGLNEAELYVSANPFQNNEQLQNFSRNHSLNSVCLSNENSISLKKQEWYLNRRTYIYHQAKRPYIVLKWAQTSDGFVARLNYDSKWISGVHSRKLVHRWRSQESAIWVGKNTYRYDNPRLNVRDWVGENPIRIVIDREGTLDEQLHVFDRSQPTLYYANQPTDHPAADLTCIALPQEKNWKKIISFVLADLYRRKITSVFVEGGSQLLSFLIRNDWWDEARVFQSKVAFDQGISAPNINEEYIANERFVGTDRLTTYLKAKQKVEK